MGRPVEQGEWFMRSAVRDAVMTRELALLVTGAGVSSFGSHLTFTAVPLHLSQQGPGAVVMFMIAGLVPHLLGAPLSGRLVDRFPNRRMLIAAQLGAAAAVGGMAFALDSLPVLLLLQVLAGAFGALTTPASAALLPRITGEEGATRGYSALAAAHGAGMWLGLGFGGVLAAGPGTRWALGADAVTFVVLAVALAFVRVERRGGGDRTRASFTGIRRDRLLFGCGVAVAGSTLLWVLPTVAEVYFVTEVLDAGGVGYGVVSAAWGIGMLAGPRLVANIRHDRALVAALVAGGLVIGVAILVTGIAESFVVTVVCWLVGGVGNSVQYVSVNALVRSRIPDAIRGSAFAGMNALLTTGSALGVLAGGFVTAAVGPRWSFLLSGGAVVLAGLVSLQVLVRRSR